MEQSSRIMTLTTNYYGISLNESKIKRERDHPGGGGLLSSPIWTKTDLRS